jgi:hypothetical protein
MEQRYFHISWLNFTKIFLYLLVTSTLLSATRPAQANPPIKDARQASSWRQGIYVGWVYFLARSEMDYYLQNEVLTVHDEATLFHEVHGTIQCDIVDSYGRGACSTNFPLDFYGLHIGTATSPDCQVNIHQTFRGVGVAYVTPEETLTRTGQGWSFSLPFHANIGPAYTTMDVDAKGSNPTCRSMQLSGYVPQGIRWSDLEYQIEFHQETVVGGSCDMKDFPRQMNINAMETSAHIDKCRWRLFYYDPDARLP